MKQGRAALLIERLVTSGQATQEQIAQALHISVERVDAFASGAEPIPLNYQARFSLFVIANVPAFVRAGNQLRHQVAAAITFETHKTRTSDEPPPSLRRF
jgi:hypothetical protein